MNKEKKQPAIKYFFFGILLIIAYQVILPLIYFPVFENFLKSDNFWISNLAYTGYYVIILILLMLIFHKSLKQELKIFFKNKKEYTKKAFSTWGKGILLMIISNLIVIQITGAMAGNEEQNRTILNALPLYAAITMCFVGPFIEELVFRKSFKGSFKNKYAYAVITSLIFASLHVLNGFEEPLLQNMLTNWTQFLYLIPYGSLAFFFATTYYETDNIFISTLAHCFHNTLSILLVIIAGTMI